MDQSFQDFTGESALRGCGLKPTSLFSGVEDTALHLVLCEMMAQVFIYSKAQLLTPWHRYHFDGTGSKIWAQAHF